MLVLGRFGRFQLERSSERYVEYVLLSSGERVSKKSITGEVRGCGNL